MLKGRLSLLSFVIFLSVCLTATAQEKKPDSPNAQNKPQTPDFVRMMRSDVMRQGQKRMGKVLLRSMWNSKGPNIMVFGLMNDPEIRKGVGITDEQQKQFQVGMMARMTANTEIAELNKQLQAIQKDDRFLEKADEATKQKFFDTQEKLATILSKSLPDDLDQFLSKEQVRKLQEMQLASMSELPIITPGTFEALDLTDEQRKKMETIKKDLEPGFEKTMDGLMDSQMKAMDMIFAKIEKDGTTFDDPSKIGETIQAVRDSLKDDPAFRALVDGAMDQGRIFVNELKFKMFDVLTDEQLARLEEIMNNPPEYVRQFLEKIRKQMGRQQHNAAANAFMDAWKPGEPVPDEYKQQRKRKAFPMKEN